MCLLRAFSTAIVLFASLASSRMAGAEATGWTSTLKEGVHLSLSLCKQSQCLDFDCLDDGSVGYALPMSSTEGATYAIDGQPIALDLARAQHEPIVFDPVLDGPLFTALQTGRQLFVQNRYGTLTLPLAGANPAMPQFFQSCAALRSGYPIARPGFGAQALRRPDEDSMALPSPGEEKVQYQNMQDIPGHDIDGGLSNPLLRGISANACIDLCRQTPGCMAITHNDRRGDVCFLKNATGPLVRSNEASSRLLHQVWQLQPPPTAGLGASVHAWANWGERDTVEGYFSRLRGASAPLGGDCAVEAAAAQALVQSFGAKLRGAESAEVGRRLAVEWGGNSLQARVPVWLMVSADQPVRFSGRGFFSLGPEAPNPFGLQTGTGKTRALVALWARGAGPSGRIEIEPLLTRELNLKVQLVAFYRRCNSEAVLGTQDYALHPAPGGARIVVNNEIGRASYTHRITLPKWNRRIDFNATRLLITALSDGTEILERAGRDLSLSPTQRFMTAVTDEGTLVLDLIDGARVATVPEGSILWGTGDSLVMETHAPWGEVHLHNTFGGPLQVERIRTGPSCCDAETGTRVAVDYQNAIVAIGGDLGGFVAALQNPRYTTGSSPENGYISDSGYSLAAELNMAESVGPVAPLSYRREIQFAGGVSATSNGADAYVMRKETSDPLAVTLAHLRAAGQSPTELPAQAPLALTAPLNALERIGITVASQIDDDPLVPFEMAKPESPLLRSFQERVSRSGPHIAAFRALARKQGWTFGWNEPTDIGMMEECDHISTSDLSDEHDNLLPRDAVGVNVVNTPEGTVWALFYDCEAGATYGTFRGRQMLVIADLRRPALGKSENIVADWNAYYGNAPHPKFWQRPFRVRLSDRLLITYAPHQGALSVFDLDTRKFRFSTDKAPDGDLLRMAWLTADRRHLLQLNDDGGFYLHRISDGRVVLSGRIVDDETVVWTDDFHFDATAEGAALIDLRFPGAEGQFSLGRFDKTRHVAGLAAQVMAGMMPRDAGALAIPPQLRGQIVPGNGAQISAVLSFDARRPASEVQVYQDGVLSDRIDVTGRTSLPLSVPRLPGTRWVTLIAANAQGVESVALSRDLGPPVAPAHRRALIVGVDRYQDDRLPDLNYAKSDADRLLNALQTRAYQSVALVDRRASAPAVLAALSELVDGLSPGDSGVVFFAGHGLRDEAGRFYLGTSQMDLDRPEDTALAWADVAAILARSRAKITVLLDACHSGAAGTTAFASNDDAVAALSSIPSNVTILAASKGRETSAEDARQGGGLFTTALVDVLGAGRDKADTNRNGSLEVSEFYRGVKAAVQARSAAQTPWIARSRLVGDYSLF